MANTPDGYDAADVATELDVLRIVSDRLGRLGIPFMLTGSYAMAYYETPRMTRDLDLVVALRAADVEGLVAEFAPDFYVDPDAVLAAVRAERLFNLMHLASGIKVDMIVRKSTPYRELEFSRRTRGELSGVAVWLTSRENINFTLPQGAMHDTAPEFARIVAERHRAMTPAQRLRVASEMFDTARAIVESSLAPGLTRYERRLALSRRMYGDELPVAAHEAFARYEFDT